MIATLLVIAHAAIKVAAWLVPSFILTVTIMRGSAHRG